QDTCPGIKKGGVLTVVRPEVELEVLAGEIPDAIDVELGEAEIGDTLSISGVTLPEGAKSVIDRDFVIANIQPPKNAIADDDDGEAGDEAEADAPAEESGDDE
ncbi:MAG: 50S ribosomal protein L25, partial [Pseudomonadota bacterium]